jgi:hypothetical protein
MSYASWPSSSPAGATFARSISCIPGASDIMQMRGGCCQNGLVGESRDVCECARGGHARTSADELFLGFFDEGLRILWLQWEHLEDLWVARGGAAQAAAVFVEVVAVCDAAARKAALLERHKHDLRAHALPAGCQQSSTPNGIFRGTYRHSHSPSSWERSTAVPG